MRLVEKTVFKEEIQLQERINDWIKLNITDQADDGATAGKASHHTLKRQARLHRILSRALRRPVSRVCFQGNSRESVPIFRGC